MPVLLQVNDVRASLDEGKVIAVRDVLPLQFKVVKLEQYDTLRVPDIAVLVQVKVCRAVQPLKEETEVKAV
jgi:hypothetical protein